MQRCWMSLHWQWPWSFRAGSCYCSTLFQRRICVSGTLRNPTRKTSSTPVTRPLLQILEMSCLHTLIDPSQKTRAFLWRSTVQVGLCNVCVSHVACLYNRHKESVSKEMYLFHAGSNTAFKWNSLDHIFNISGCVQNMSFTCLTVSHENTVAWQLTTKTDDPFRKW